MSPIYKASRRTAQHRQMECRLSTRPVATPARGLVRWKIDLKSTKSTTRLSTRPLNTSQHIAPPLHVLSTEALVQDLNAVDAALSMSPMMQSALRTGAREHSVAFACGQMRLVWQRELAKRACTDTPN